jgi:hypothetical protein
MRIRRRRLLVFGLLAGLFAVGVGGWMLWPRTAITREDAAKIQVGMTLEEVEAILGGPPRSDASGNTVVDMRADTIEQERATRIVWQKIVWQSLAMYRHVAENDGNLVIWESDDVFVWVRLEDRRVTGSGQIPFRRVYESPIEIVRRWLRF